MNLKSNIWKIYGIQVLRWFMLIMPIFVLFLQENGLSIGQVLILQSFFSIFVVLMEIPSGYLADLWGRKNIIVLGCIAGFLGPVIYSMSYSFEAFLVAEFFLAIGWSFISGADSALLYDSLLASGSTDNYKKLEGRKGFFASGAEGLAGIVGGLLAIYSLRLPFVIQAVVLFFTIPLALSLIEPPRSKFKAEAGNFKELWRIIKFSLYEHVEIKWLIIYSSLISASGISVVWFIQPYFIENGLPLEWFGIAWAILQITTAIFSFYAYRIEGFVGKRNAFISLIFIIFLGYALTAYFNALWAAVFFLLFYIVRGINQPVSADYVNKLITSDIRATVLSIKNLMMRLIFAAMGPFMGWMVDIYSLQTAFILGGSVFLVLGLISLIFLHKHRVI